MHWTIIVRTSNYKSWKDLREIGIESIAELERIVKDFRTQKRSFEPVRIKELLSRMVHPLLPAISSPKFMAKLSINFGEILTEYLLLATSVGGNYIMA